MKYVRNLLPKLTALGVAIIATSFIVSAQAQMQQGKAQVKAVRGSAQYSVDGGAWEALTVGTVLRPGAVVKTAAASEVDLFLDANGPAVRIKESTTLGIDKLLFEKTGVDTVIETQLDLQNGRILGNVKKLAAASKYEVNVPTGVVGISGTVFDISSSGIVHVIEGSVVVVYINPFTGATSSHRVNQGETFVPPTEEGAEPVVELMTPELMNQLGSEVNQMVRVVTPEVPGAPTVIIVEPEEPYVSPVEGKSGSSGSGG
ncbi:MAG: FecR domain-containing protein [Verrucomicrobia bacterium]|nr:FecR domain-containing protein [Verrucomicrobiota bacterium]MCF7709375.1 FecR domain-containing protein [Verrucomicrobiota bacterium]